MENEEFFITATFDIPRDTMWELWTKPEHVKHWFGPKGITITQVTVDLRPGGNSTYSMRSPDGDSKRGRWTYRTLTRPEHIVAVVSFLDAQDNVISHPMMPTWPREMLSDVRFIEKGQQTTIEVRWKPAESASEAEHKTFRENFAAMQGGWSGTFERMEEYLKSGFRSAA